MQQLLKVYSIALMAGMCSMSLYAIQPISDESMALAAGENTIVLDSDLVNSKKFIPEQDKSLVEEPAYQSVLLFNLYYPTSMVKLSGEQSENFTKYFGLEPLSYQWDGNYEDIWDFSRFSNITFNDTYGQYELNNVQGRVWVEVDVVRRDDAEYSFNTHTLSRF